MSKEVEKEKEELQQKVDALQQDNDKFRAALTAAEASADITTERAQWAESMADLQDEVASQRMQLETAKDAAKALIQEAAATKVELDQVKVERDSLSAHMAEMEALKSALDESALATSRCANDFAVVNTKMADLEEEMAAKIKMVDILKRELSIKFLI